MACWLLPLGYLAYRSPWFPKALGVLLFARGACYIVALLAAFLAPTSPGASRSFIVIPCTVAEFWMIGYPLVVGVKTVQHVHPDDRILAKA